MPGVDALQADSPQVGNVSPQEPGHWTRPLIVADMASSPSWTGPDHPHQHPVQQTAHWPIVGITADGDSEAEINAAEVAAYRASSDNRQPLSERKLAAMFGKTSRRWARHRISDARQSSVVAPATWARSS
jgi:hypothetical protein